MQVREARLGQDIEPTLASLAIPGAGQLLQGRLFRAAFWFLPALGLWVWTILPYELGPEVILVIALALMLHIASARDAFRAAHISETARSENLWDVLPPFLIMKVLGSILLGVTAFHLLITGADLLQALIESQVRWGGGSFPYSITLRAGQLAERMVIMVGVGVVGFALYQIGSLWQMRTREQTREQRMLQEARARGGSLTVPEAAAVMHLRFEEAHDLLEQMAQRRWIGVSIAENGQKVYQFFASLH